MNISNGIRPQKTSDTTQDRKFDHRRIFKFWNETQTFKNMGYEMALVNR